MDGRSRAVAAAGAPAPDQDEEVSRMEWQAPSFEVIRMDAEINAYQDDFDRDEFEG
jgi:hypothetical protein